MDLTQTRQLLLVALSSPSSASLQRPAAIKTLLTKAGKDIHWLANLVGQRRPRPPITGSEPDR